MLALLACVHSLPTDPSLRDTLCDAPTNSSVKETMELMEMMAVVNGTVRNPLSGLIGDDVYELLETHNLLNEKGVRDYQIRKRFREMRTEDVPAYDAIESLRDEYPYLQFDTIRKIVYKLNGKR